MLVTSFWISLSLAALLFLFGWKISSGYHTTDDFGAGLFVVGCWLFGTLFSVLALILGAIHWWPR